MADNTENEPKKVTLPYFHRTLSDADKALVGDTSPKPITVTPVANTFSGAPSSGSAWNAAGSWEERDYSDKCTHILESIFNITWDVPNSPTPVLVLACEDISGTASLVHSKGKARYLYSFSFTLTAEATLTFPDTPARRYTVKLSVEDVSNDQPWADYDVGLAWAGPSPPGKCVADVKKVFLGRCVREAIGERVKVFEGRFRELGGV